MAAQDEYFAMTAEGTQAGPLTLEQLEERLRFGVFSPATLVVRSGTDVWRPLGEIVDEGDETQRGDLPSTKFVVPELGLSKPALSKLARAAPLPPPGLAVSLAFLLAAHWTLNGIAHAVDPRGSLSGALVSLPLAGALAALPFVAARWPKTGAPMVVVAIVGLLAAGALGSLPAALAGAPGLGLLAFGVFAPARFELRAAAWRT
ncbi:MAG: DUF4339 domain-containing protein [Polyangiaceae bacterium]|nr:DUF4339 domain-containing protein [Polyangiaceae bacterium]